MRVRRKGGGWKWVRVVEKYKLPVISSGDVIMYSMVTILSIVYLNVAKSRS